MRQVTQAAKGDRPINRPASFGRKKRLVKKLIGKSTWFQNSNKRDPKDAPKTAKGSNRKETARSNRSKPETVIFVPHTPYGELKKKLMEVDDLVTGSCKFSKVKVVETLGQKLNQSISNTAPWKSSHCQREGCGPCQAKEGSCRVKNCTYSVKCLHCGSIYWGETHRTFRDRAVEHQVAIRTGDVTNALAKHHEIHHKELPPDFSFKLDRKWKTTLARQIGESLLIMGEVPHLLMNSKSEFGSSNRDTRDHPNFSRA